jgi:hypothetical protein
METVLVRHLATGREGIPKDAKGPEEAVCL